MAQERTGSVVLFAVTGSVAQEGSGSAQNVRALPTMSIIAVTDTARGICSCDVLAAGRVRLDFSRAR